MPRIRITRIPLGDAPDEVKVHWVGVELDAVGPMPEIVAEFKNPTELHDRIVYLVGAQQALAALILKDLKAAAWFFREPAHPIGPGRRFAFLQNDCVEVTPTQAPAA